MACRTFRAERQILLRDIEMAETEPAGGGREGRTDRRTGVTSSSESALSLSLTLMDRSPLWRDNELQSGNPSEVTCQAQNVHVVIGSWNPLIRPM